MRGSTFPWMISCCLILQFWRKQFQVKFNFGGNDAKLWSSKGQLQETQWPSLSLSRSTEYSTPTEHQFLSDRGLDFTIKVCFSGFRCFILFFKSPVLHQNDWILCLIVDIDDRVMVVSKAIQYINVKFINNPFKVKSFATNAVFNNAILFRYISSTYPQQRS